MPGTHLNDFEKKIINRWETAAYDGFLEELSVDGKDGNGLRGIKSLKVHFKTPVTVISGKNGSGKSTILALCALAFHGLENSPSRNSRNGKYYTFKDFFFKGNGDPEITGIEISWKYKGNPIPLKIKKKTDKWMHYERRPEKAVHFIGISRCIPAFEQSALRGHFGSNKRAQNSIQIDSGAKKYLQAIIGKKYKTAGTLSSARYKIRSCSSDATYTSFNMGTGEDIVIDLLNTLFSAPEKSLIIIEEIELGLHPSAQRELAQALTKIAFERKLQIIISSHSEYIIDNLPRNCRILLERGKKEHHIQYKVTTRAALSSLTNTSNSELLIFCEDEFAKSVIQSTLPQESRQRVELIPRGADSELIRAVSHHQGIGHKHKSIVIWDGDVELSKIRNWTKEELKRNPKLNLNFTRLPGDTPPEPWAIEKIQNSEAALEQLTESLKIKSVDEAYSILEQAETNLNHHSLSDTFSHRLNITKSHAQSMLSQVISEAFFEELSHIPELVNTILES
ncbi:AAA family ATPase [Pseudomonas aeruginosa]|uniref:ATP-dependent nuclease n=1 Tax=Pseudomonas aeruginosa TaxID=287 RepID=UPI0008FB2C0B|nr:AAA family ATPase [Pseudomonas aeruginosa]MCO1669792.1 ATP-binding protein [Pseudomonas aeruginosa]MCO1765630.1 ATP-binding protein [Pseudomonas aeruginosa]OPE39560.1 hypothetical protein APB60_30325 [Pseudomonas aeruginosa]QMX79315.1 ATP-binding protein [Pseudomonas aeruginosa]RPP83141.1 ATP-binding protein [Pseudomonas aeruginosa]